ncbi:MAG: CoB--CoM heterodisulfide reductase iron-sulfur subunit B family protein [Syntrophaceae bacterium]|nr:CoB--CoM heterodisulfide reductase iron-sulfur subunit B family protein [Syntrophaceae bacterium]
MQVGYYPGCSLESSAKEFDLSIRAILQEMKISLKDIPDWNCCGASPAHYLNEELAQALPYRNLVKAEEAGLDRVISPCPACYSHLKHIHEEVLKETHLADRLESIVGKKYNGGIVSKHLLDFIKEDIGFDRLKSSVKLPLSRLRVVNYYGCLTRLPGVRIDDMENPTLMDEVISILGGEALEWSHKTECCGASLSVSRTEIALRLVNSILEAAKERQVDCIAVVCPLCQSNLDTRQGDINKRFGTTYEIPILYLSQLIGLAQKLNYSQLGLDRLVTSPQNILIEKGIIEK